jgi:hypothetical protein
MKKIVLIILFIVLLITSSFSQSLESINDVIKLTNSVMDKFASGQIELGLDIYKLHTLLSDSDFNVIKTQYNSKSKMIESNYGLCLGTEIAYQEQIGESLFKIIYLQKHTRYALRWDMVFYKSETEWKLVNILYSDKILDLFSK